MALTISLKPGEQAIVGKAVIINEEDRRIRLTIKNNVTILREKDVLKIEEADTPCKRVYFTIQLMYIDEENLAEYHKAYWRDAEDIIQAAPSCYQLIEKISKSVVGYDYYKALKLCKELIAYEAKLLELGRKRKSKDAKSKRSLQEG